MGKEEYFFNCFSVGSKNELAKNYIQLTVFLGFKSLKHLVFTEIIKIVVIFINFYF